MKLFISVFTVVLISIQSFAVSHFTLTGRARSKPQAVNLIGEWAYDIPLWGNPAPAQLDPMYGYASVGTHFGGSPTISAFVSVAPIAPVVFTFEKSMTERFGRSVNFPCDSVECRGRIERSDVSIEAAAAFKQVQFLGGFLWRDIKTAEATKNIMIELEDLSVTPGGHRFVEANAFLGYKIDEVQSAGVLYSAGEIKELSLGYQSTYAIYRTRYQNFSITAGVGIYQSDIPDLNGTSAILSLSRSWGETLALF